MPPLSTLNEAQKRYPALRYAYGAVGLAAAGAVIISLLGSTTAIIAVLGGTFVAMVMMWIFSVLLALEKPIITPAAILLLYSTVLFYFILVAFTASALAGGPPQFWAELLGLKRVVKFHPIKAQYSYVGGPWQKYNMQPGGEPIVFYQGPLTGNQYGRDIASCEMDEGGNLIAVNQDSAAAEVRSEPKSAGCAYAISKGHLVTCCFR